MAIVTVPSPVSPDTATSNVFPSLLGFVTVFVADPSPPALPVRVTCELVKLTGSLKITAKWIGCALVGSD